MTLVEQSRGAAGLPVVGVIVALIGATALSAQDSKELAMSPEELVRTTVRNEVAAADHPNLHHMFHSRRQTSKDSQTRVYVETNQALAEMLIGH